MDGDQILQLPIQTREAPITSVDTKTRTVELTWSAGGRVKRYDWERGQYFMEELSLDPAHVRLGRLQSSAPLLDTHQRFSLQGVIGVVEPGTVKVDGKRGTAVVRFSSREDVEPIFRDVKDKIIVNVSCGYVVHRMEQLPADERSEGLLVYRAIDWEPMELSLVPIGADAGAGVRSEQQRTFPCVINSRGAVMQEATSEAEVTAQENHKPSPAEIHRARTINEICTRGGLPAEFSQRLIADGMPLAEARAVILGELAKRTDSTPIRSGLDMNAGVGDVLTEIRAMAESVAARFGGPKATPAANPYMHLRTVDLARHCLEMRGERTTMMSPSRIIERALSHSAGDFPALLTETGNRTLRAKYEAYQGGVKMICRQSTAPDFRAKQRVVLGEGPALKKVLPGGEVTSGSMAEAKESYTLATYARIFSINRQALVNDDLGAFVDMTGKLGQASAEFVCTTLAQLLQSNPTMGVDNKALFHTDHGNYTSSGTVINVDNLGIGFKMMRKQKGLDGVTPINVAPKFLVVSAAKETLARQYAIAINATKSSDVNPYAGDLEVIVDPRLDASAPNAWYLAADPTAFDTIEFSYLDDEPGPQVLVRQGFDVEGVEMKVRLDFGAGVLDFRGLYMNAGA